MGVPLSQMWAVAQHVLKHRWQGTKRYPLVLMLEPLFRCNLACAGCGKIQYPTDILRRHLTPEECFRAVDECPTPIVVIPGGEPLLHPQMNEIVAGLVARKKYVYVCTNALLLEKHLERYTPSKFLTFSIHLDGPQHEHDFAVCREGVYEIAISAIRAALKKGFRVTTNTTVFNNADPDALRSMFDTLMGLGVEGMMISPGYQYEKAPAQELFLRRQQTVGLFRQILGAAKRSWRFNLSPLFMEFLQGRWELECTPWGNPTYNLFGWQRPCYLLQEGYTATFQELLETTDWSNYGRASGNPKCADCMMHCGYEPTAVAETFTTWRGFTRVAWLSLFGPPRQRLSDTAAATAADSSTRPGSKTSSPVVPLSMNWGQGSTPGAVNSGGTAASASAPFADTPRSDSASSQDASETVRSKQADQAPPRTAVMSR
jgi:hopanoid biosynthesis associated radical SAM protein HpnH